MKISRLFFGFSGFVGSLLKAADNTVWLYSGGEGSYSIPTRAGKAFVAFLAVMVSACSYCSESSCFTLYNIVPYSPGHEAEAAISAREYHTRTGGNIVLYSLSLHPEGKPAIEKAQRYISSYRAFRREMEGSGMRVGILVQSILGHWPRVDKDIEDWTRTINIKGEKVRFCPDGPGFAAYVEAVFRLIAAERPDFVLLDDDVRAYSHDAECFCPRHVSEFNAVRGTSYTEKQLREKVSSSRKEDEDYKVFLSIQREMMERLVKRIRRVLDASGFHIPAGVCVAEEETFLASDLARAVAAKGQIPVMRVSTGCYIERYASRLAYNITRKLGYIEYLRGSGIEVLDEADTCPHNLWSKSSTSFFTHMEVASFLGFKGAKVWYVNGNKLRNGPVSRAYTDILADNRGVLDALSGVAEAFPQMDGVAVPCFSRFPRWHLAHYHKEMQLDADQLIGKVLIPFGIPFRAEKDFSKRGVYVLSSRFEIERMTDQDLEDIFSGRVIVLGEAAVALSARGRRDLIGFSAAAAKFDFNVERSRSTGVEYGANTTDKMPYFSNLAPGAVVLSDLGFKPYPTSQEFEAVAPGAVSWRNALGGRVVSTAFHCNMSVHRQTSESRKRYFLSLIASLNGEDLAFVCGNDQDVMMLVRRGAGSTAMVQAVNLNLDPIRTLRLRVPRKASVSVLAPHGKWNELDSSFDGEFVSIDVSIAFCEAKTFKIKMEE